MGIEAPNLPGANLRQVVTQADQVAQHLQAFRKDSAEFQARLGTAMIEKVMRTRDQASNSPDTVVHRQEDQAQFSAGDALNHGNGGPSGGEEEASGEDSNQTPAPDLAPNLELLDDPFGVAERFGQELRKLGKEAVPLVFREMDRRLLAGLSRPDTVPKAAETYRQQAILTGGSADTVRGTLEAALRESLALAGGTGGDLDRLRKLLSLVRQGCRPESAPGHDLSSLAGHMLVKISRELPGAVVETLGLLSHLVGSIREWRGDISRGMLPTWATR
jgi:hypothetical protein